MRLAVRSIGLAIGCVVSSLAWSQALPVYTAPANKVGAALAEGVTQTLVRRGFAANDPRVFQTIRALGARVIPLATAAGGGANWLGVVARLSPWVMTGLLVYTGVKWYFNSDGNVVTSIGGVTVAGNGVVLGGQCYYVLGSDFCGSTPEEALTYYRLTNTYYTDITKITLTVQSTSGYGARYTASYEGHRVGDAVTIWPDYNVYSIYASTATATCPVGQGALSGTCVPSKIDLYHPAASSSGPQPIQTAYNNLSQDAKNAQLSPQVAAEVANRIWRDAALQPDYVGVPWSSDVSVTAPDFAAHQTAHPADWPTTSALNDAVPTASTPLVSPESNPNQVVSPSSATKVDLGPDPGVGQPTLDEPPSGLFQPIKDLMTPWLNWQVPTHSGQCPTWQMSPTVGGRTFYIDLSSHCAIAEERRATILAVSLVCWVVIAAFIVLSA